MEREGQLCQSYEFWFFNGETRITVTFLGPHAWKYSGADHTFPHQKRRSWALSLMRAYPGSWRALPLHEYLTTLQERGFQYDEFLVQTSDHENELHIICRSVEHL